MPSNDYLIQRNGVWYYRRRVPASAQEGLGQTVVKQSLKTSSIKTAREQRDQVNALWSKRFKQASDALSVSSSLRKLLSREEVFRRASDYVQTKDAEYEFRFLDAALTDDQRHEHFMDACNEREQLKDRSDIETEIAIDRAASAILGKNGAPNPKELSWNQCLSIVQDALIEIENRHIAWLSRDRTREHFDHRFASGQINARQKPSGSLGSGISFSKLSDEYLTQYRDEAESRGRTPKTINKAEFHVRLLLELVGSGTLVTDINFDAVRSVRDRLNRIPTNMNKRYKGKGLDEAAELEASGSGRFLAHNTQAAILRTLNSVVELAVKKELIANNPAAGLRPLAKKASAKDARKPFSDNDLKAIFNAPLYRGCENDQHGFAKPGPYVIKGTRFWVPLLALWTGMRANEICQLKVGDVAKRDGHWTIRVSDEGAGQTIKNASSRRLFPVHPKLVQMGFVEFREKQAGDLGSQLFADLTPDGYGYHSTRLTRWFDDRFLPKYVSERQGKSFHSFRHNYRDALRSIDAPEPILRSLCGWAEGNAASANYGSGYAVHHLMTWVERVDFPSLDLAHLHTV